MKFVRNKKMLISGIGFLFISFLSFYIFFTSKDYSGYDFNKLTLPFLGLLASISNITLSISPNFMLEKGGDVFTDERDRLIASKTSERATQLINYITILVAFILLIYNSIHESQIAYIISLTLISVLLMFWIISFILSIYYNKKL